MKIYPTLEGGLSVQPESDYEWSMLEMIPQDIGLSGRLAESLAGLMDDESEWDEWVVPDLVEAFDAQGAYVAEVIAKTRHSPEVLPVFVTKDDVDSWYGAVNQARLGLHSLYQLDSLDSLDDVSEEVAAAYFRDRFYTALLSLFLEYIMGSA